MSLYAKEGEEQLLTDEFKKYFEEQITYGHEIKSLSGWWYDHYDVKQKYAPCFNLLNSEYCHKYNVSRGALTPLMVGYIEELEKQIDELKNNKL